MFDLDLTTILLTVPGVILGFSVHEFSHAIVADRLGDPTPRNQGKLTLSPKEHIDPVGLILILFAGFGWAKPVETNPRNFRNPKRDSTLVSLAGPVSNLLIAILFGILLKIILAANIFDSTNSVGNNLILVFDRVIWINVILFVFNLIPIPPLDGFHVLSNIISFKNYNIINFLYRYGFVILIIFILTGFFSKVIRPLYISIYNTIYTLLGII
ncbi:MAG: site-2 protease family protein [Clostridia bacterium]|nr:site-2 protease family protein [Clostridia bacterium]